MIDDLEWTANDRWHTLNTGKFIASFLPFEDMSKKPTPKKRRNSPLSEARQGSPAVKPATQGSYANQKQGPRWFLIGLFITIVIGGGTLAMIFKDARMWESSLRDIEQFTYEVVKKYPHDPLAFTQGLFVYKGKLYESTGRKGESTMRIVDIETGETDPRIYLGPDLFGEGAAVHDDKVYQLTWKEEKCLVYDLELKDRPEIIEYEGEGWGLCSDGEHLIMTDSGPDLIFVDPKDFSIQKRVTVKLGNRPLLGLNEMEYFGGKIYANKLGEDAIFEVDAETGKVVAMIDLTGLWPPSERPQGGVLNGIAYDEDNEKIYVTGKYCPHLYEIAIVPKPRR